MAAEERPERIIQSELRIEFAKRVDREGKTYYLAKPRLPISVDLSNAALFFWIDDGPSMTVRIERERRPDGDET